MERFVWRMNKAGNLNKLKLQKEQLSDSLDENMLRVKTASIGLNFADIFAVLGLYSATPKGSFIPGLEAAGIVIDCGRNVKSIKVGDRVAVISRFGAFSSILDIEVDYAYKIPENWSYAEGSAYLVQTITAFYALTHLGNVKAKDNVIINSAAGGVGIQAMRIAKFLKANPIGLVRSITKKNFLSEIGFNDVFVRNENLINNLKRNKDYQLFLDANSGKTQKEIFKILGPTARMVVFGAADFTPTGDKPNFITLLFKYLARPKYDPMAMVNTNKSILAFNLIWLYDNKKLLKKIMSELMDVDISPPYIGKTFLFTEMHEAIKYFRSGESIGKVVLELPEKLDKQSLCD